MKRKFIFIITAILILGLTNCSKDKAEKKSPAAQAEDRKIAAEISVNVITLKTDSIEKTLTGKGSLQSKEKAIISPKLSGKIAKIFGEEGDSVKKGQIVAELEKEYIILARKQAAANLERVKAEYQRSKDDLERLKNLLEKESIPRQKYDHSLAEFNIIKANIEQAKAALENVETQLRDADIISPIEGTITSKLKDVGDMASIDKPIFKIEKLNILEFKIDCPGSELNNIKNGIAVRINIEGFQQNSINCVVNKISPILNEHSRTVELTVYIDNSAKIYKPGMFGIYEMILEKKENILKIPKDLIVERAGKKCVFIVKENLALLTNVETGIEQNNFVEIIKGLNAGDKIVSSGQNLLAGGESLKIQELK